MIKKSLKLKITVWFSAAIIIISCVAVLATVLVSGSVIQKGIRENLVETVENNLDEVEFYSDYDKLEFDDPYDLCIEYKSGWLEIDDDFLKSVNGITTSLYDESGLIYGDDSIFSGENSPSFGNRIVSSVKTETGTFYVYDIELKLPEIGNLWLRGTVSSEYSITQMNKIFKIVLMLIPVLVLFAIVGGYIIARRALSPIIEIAAAADNIRTGNDLSKRIEIGEGDDEIHRVAKSFNSMFERLEDSFNKEQQLTSDISHELRTPLSVIFSQCQYTLEERRTSEEYIDALELIERQSKKMSSVTNDMLAFARIERGAGEVKKEKLNLSECVSSLCEDMALIDEKGITLSSDVEPEIYINGNFELISRLCVNLISNAYRYGNENGTILVSLKKTGETSVLSVSDNGIGIDESDIEKIWNRFYRADSSRSSGGTGLGLSFVREIAEIHGASVSVQSEKGKGSVFCVTFKNYSL